MFRPGVREQYAPAPMDLFEAACQGVGLAVAAGMLAGAPGKRDGLGYALLALAIVAGAILFGASLATEDHPAWPGWPVGGLIAAGIFFVVSDFAAGAAKRAEGGGVIAGTIALTALATAGLSLLFGPLGLIALLASICLWVGRRRRAATKYEGLRTLR
jgi:hypothetical protein